MRERLDLPLRLVSMKNDRRPTPDGIGACSEAAEQFKRDAGWLLKMYRGATFKKGDALILRVMVTYPDYTQDLDCELVPDVLQAAGIIPNDRQFMEKHYYRNPKTGDPLVAIEIERNGELPWKQK